MFGYPRNQFELETFQVEDWQAQRQKAIRALPRRTRKLAQHLLDGLPESALGMFTTGEKGRERAARFSEALQKLTQLKSRDRQGVFAAFFPQLAVYLEAAWQLHAQLPIQHGNYRKAFRAPDRPDLVAPSQTRWFQRTLVALNAFDPDLPWLAVWAPKLFPYSSGLEVGALLAAAVNTQDGVGEEVLAILTAAAKGEHPEAVIGRHVITALLLCERPDAWELVEQLLLAAQRQEGLRQVILESIDFAQPEAFVRMLRLIGDHKLLRFSSAVRAADVWFGLQWDSADARQVGDTLAQVSSLLEDPQMHAAARDAADPERRYLALWVTAFHNAPRAVNPAAALLKHEQVEMRFIGVQFLGLLGLPEGGRHLLAALRDSDRRVVAAALLALRAQFYGFEEKFRRELFAVLAEILPGLPATIGGRALVWPWMEMSVSRQQAATLLIDALGEGAPLELMAFKAYFDARARARLARLLAAYPKHAPAVRTALFELVSDRSLYVRQEVFIGLKAHVASQALAPGEIEVLEALLVRKSSDVRRGVLAVLLQDPRIALGSAARLLAGRNKQQRLAGLELLQDLHGGGTYTEESEALARQFRARALAADEKQLVESIIADDEPDYTLAQGLGLYDPAERTPAPVLVKHPRLLALGSGRSLVSKEASDLWFSLDDFVHQHRSEKVRRAAWSGGAEELLGNLRFHFAHPSMFGGGAPADPKPPLAAQLSAWWDSEGRRLAGPERLGLVQAVVADGGHVAHAFTPRLPAWVKRLQHTLYGDLDVRRIRYYGAVKSYLLWLNLLFPAENTPDYLLDAAEHGLALIPEKELRRKPADMKYQDIVIQRKRTWRDERSLFGWLDLAQTQRALVPGHWQPAQDVRLYQLLRWLDEPLADLDIPRHPPKLEYALAAYDAGGAVRADLFDHLLQSPSPLYYGGPLRVHSGLKPDPLRQRYPVLTEIVDQARARVVEIETQRGDLPTEVSSMAVSLRHAGGMAVLADLMAAFGRSSFVRGYSYTNTTSKGMVFSRLIQATYPERDDTPAAFASLMAERGIASKRLIELAVYAPQWAAHVEAALTWDGLVDGVWWLHAHTKDINWRVDQALREHWAAAISERTPLTAQDLLDGAVDVSWFQRAHARLGQERWMELYQAAKLASSGSGHVRAKLFADGMLNMLDRGELEARLVNKRYQDGARALGLVPLPEGRERAGEIHARYRLLMEFLRTGRKFGAQRRTSEKLAVRIGLANLARTAGYADPARLQWDMEADELADLVDGRAEAAAQDITLRLLVTPWGSTELTIEKDDGRRLKKVPARIKKEPQVAKILELQTTIKRQVVRMRRSLEEAMLRGDPFQGRDLISLLAHPTLGVILSQLVMLGKDACGFPVVRGRQLEHYDGTKGRIKVNDTYRIAHPLDLLAAGDWHAWQQASFREERIQPFKQVFREVYVLTQAEQRDPKTSQRYAGHQINPRQALGLLSSRLWIARPEEGISRTFHEEGLIAHLELLNTWGTPAEVEGATLEGVSFARRDAPGLLDLADVPERIFSEVMRDLDLVVSVAHRGGVDPEASHSTIEMRTALLRETLPWMKIENVTLKDSWALIEGQRGSYNVHLGSGVVHLQPGGALCIIPVHAQQRGRLFLPFADDDPRTAEVVSKVLLLARDADIKDPTILEQIL